MLAHIHTEDIGQVFHVCKNMMIIKRAVVPGGNPGI
jgi:hypothetical protein